MVAQNLTPTEAVNMLKRSTLSKVEQEIFDETDLIASKLFMPEQYTAELIRYAIWRAYTRGLTDRK